LQLAAEPGAEPAKERERRALEQQELAEHAKQAAATSIGSSRRAAATAGPHEARTMLDTTDLDPFVALLVKYLGVSTFVAIVAYHVIVAKPPPPQE